MDGSTERDTQLWKLLAFCSRYGHQPLSELKRMPLSDLRRYAAALAEIVREENPDPQGG